MNWTRTAMGVALVGTACGGCSGESGASRDEPPVARLAEPTLAGPVHVPVPPWEAASAAPPGLQAVVDAARADAAARTGAAASSLVITSAEPVVWSDGSLGCPVPGMAYTMALVPGFRVRVRVGDSMLDYHAGGRQLILCPPGNSVDPAPVQSK